MKESEILRLLIITQDGQTGSFNSNLLKLVTMVLYDSAKTTLTVDEIRNEVAFKYELEFTNDEILKAIKKSRSGIIITSNTIQITRQGKVYYEKQDCYSLDNNIVNKFKYKEDSNKFNKIIENYLGLNPQLGKSISELEELILTFLYCTFNTNKETLMMFLKGKNLSLNDGYICDYSEEDKALLNDFLNWSNTEKDEMIYLAASYCVDYCMLTVKKDFSSYRDIFKGKSFYLDSNVIFRLAGINNEERRIVTSAFIKKCIDQGIVIKYTNFTYEEIKETIGKNVNAIEKLTRSKRAVSIKYWEIFTKPYTNLDFIKIYDEWTKKPGTIYNDFASFKKYLLRMIDEILRSFKKVNVVSYEALEPQFSSYCTSLYDYKNRKGARCNEVSIKIDVNNYLHILKLRERDKGGTFVDISDYFISTDSNLCEWGRQILPSSIPIAVLPSIWHSLILKFKGRTDNDYKAFSLFLNLRYRITDNDFDNRRPKILSLVQSLDEPVDLKDMILDDISDKLLDEYIDLTDVNEIIEKSKQSVIQMEASRLYEKKGQQLRDSARESGQVETIMKLAECSAEKKIKAYRILIKLFEIFKVLSGLVFLLSLGVLSKFWGFENLPKVLDILIANLTIERWMAFITPVISIIVFCVIYPIKQYIVSSMDFERLKAKEIKKIEKKLNSI